MNGCHHGKDILIPRTIESAGAAAKRCVSSQSKRAENGDFGPQKGPLECNILPVVALKKGPEKSGICQNRPLKCKNLPVIVPKKGPEKPQNRRPKIDHFSP